MLFSVYQLACLLPKLRLPSYSLQMSDVEVGIYIISVFFFFLVKNQVLIKKLI